ncbi:hypothetical protein CRUP_033431 [Coryphaenoides rupestris]|nr:hypothetical protein CRUP_033431 [Coryphaenoides rupestris]
MTFIFFQPPFSIATGPSLTVYLLGDASDLTLSLRTTSPSDTGSLPPPSCTAESTQWLLTKEQIGRRAVQIQLKLKRSLRLCGNNETDTDCCPQPLCVLETLQLSACQGGVPRVSMLIQARIYAMFSPFKPGSGDSLGLFLSLQLSLSCYSSCSLLHTLSLVKLTLTHSLSLSDSKLLLH